MNYYPYRLYNTNFYWYKLFYITPVWVHNVLTRTICHKAWHIQRNQQPLGNWSSLLHPQHGPHYFILGGQQLHIRPLLHMLAASGAQSAVMASLQPPWRGKCKMGTPTRWSARLRVHCTLKSRKQQSICLECGRYELQTASLEVHCRKMGPLETHCNPRTRPRLSCRSRNSRLRQQGRMSRSMPI